MIVWQEFGRLEPLVASIFAAFNAAYFLRYLYQHCNDATAARLSAGALSLLFLGGCSEGVLLVYLVQAQPDVQPWETPVWALARGISLAGAASVSFLITRRGR